MKKTKVKNQKNNQTERKELLNYIIENINILPIKDKKQVLKIIAEDLGDNTIVDCADGCRIIIDKLSDKSIETILQIIIIIDK